MVVLDDARPLFQGFDLDLVVEVADVADDGLVLHPAHVLGGDDVLVAGGRDIDVGDREGVLDGHHPVTRHAGLEGADRVDLGHADLGALAGQRLGRALADVAEAADQRHLAGDHDVGRALDAVDQRLAAAVDVVELRLGDRVVDVDCRHQQFAALGHLVETVDAGGGLLRDAFPLGNHVVPAPGRNTLHFLEELVDDLQLLVVGGLGEDRRVVLALVSAVDEEGGVAAVVHDQLRALAALENQEPVGCTTSTPRGSRPSRRRPGCRSPRWRPPRGPASRRYCTSTSALRRRAPPGSRSTPRSGWSCGGCPSRARPVGVSADHISPGSPSAPASPSRRSRSRAGPSPPGQCPSP